ncbi:MAG: peptidoglycan DD-metalloendopeptidase family protein, partial [Spirochaetaceae bacterium]|nr:peptidoglycan DD-metalloendopeptidase family protein [Spirochaetaceae bacterium]
RKIQSRQKIINGINKEIRIIDRKINNYEREISALEEELKLLKDEYARMIYKSYFSLKSFDKAQFILAATDFNQAFKRIKYLQQYSKYRREQAAKIQKKTAEINLKKEKLKNEKEEKDKLIIRNRKSVIALNNDKSKQVQIVQSLQSREKQIKRQIARKKAAYKKIESAIRNILAKASGKETGTTGMKLTPEMKILSNEFSQNIGKIPWPVKRGVITSKVGKHKHEVLKRVEVENKGVGIATVGGANVYAVFDGKVSMVAAIRGMNTTVLIQHGEYFTVYQNLVDIAVKNGQRVKVGQLIGKAFKAKNQENSEIQFGIWKGTRVLDPEIWLAK